MVSVKIALFPAVVVAAALVPLRASADAGDDLERGRDLIRSFDYGAALEAFQSVVDTADATPDQRIEAFARIGSVHFRQRHEAQARAAFQRLLNLDPGHELDDRAYSPQVRDFFGQVMSDHEPTMLITLDVSTVRDNESETRATLAIALNGQKEAVAEVVAQRRSAGETYQPLELTPKGDGFTAQLEVPHEDGVVEYYLEARAPSGYVLARHGSPDEPELFEPSRPPQHLDTEVQPARRPWYRTWWFWTVVGAVAAGGAAAAVVLTLPDEQEPGSLGSGRLQ